MSRTRWIATRYLVGALVSLVGATILVNARPLADALGEDAAQGKGIPSGPPTREQILLGRHMVITRGCPQCHGGMSPAGDGYLAGRGGEADAFVVGPSGQYKTWARNLTPDNTTGMGRFSDRQIFNALRFGLRPGETADMEITSTIPGQGNFPEQPKYLAPPMPWPYFRHMTDAELWGVVAYLKYGVKPTRHRVPDSEGPPDFWAGFYATQPFGTYPAPAYPTANEMAP